jgi:hypothetical protein
MLFFFGSLGKIKTAKGRCLLSIGVPFGWGFIRWDVNFVVRVDFSTELPVYVQGGLVPSKSINLPWLDGFRESGAGLWCVS